MTKPNKLDIFAQEVPAEWVDAAEDSGTVQDNTPLTSRKTPTFLPGGDFVDTSSLLFLTAAVSIASGVGWYVLETWFDVSSPWLVTAIGVLIAVACRVGGGPSNPGIRAVIGLIFYGITSVGAGMGLARHRFIDLYRSIPSSQELESQFLLDHATTGTSIFAAILGGVAVVALSLFLSDHKVGQ